MGTQNRVKKFKEGRKELHSEDYANKHNKTKRKTDHAWKHYTDFLDNEPSRLTEGSNMA